MCAFRFSFSEFLNSCARQGDITGFSSPTFSRHGDMRRQSITDDAMEAFDGTSSPSLRRASRDVMSPTLCREASLDVFVAPAQVRAWHL